MRVLQWIVGRCEGKAHAVETPLGLMPAYDDLVWEGLDFGPDKFAAVTAIRGAEWQRELAAHDALFEKVGDRWPATLLRERDRLRQQLF
jgi:phosphoenolpyruvate carboxykinase (GTP)